MLHQFGGKWTEEKLERLREYLVAYTTIFNKNEKAKTFNFMYIDAFAGTGYRDQRKSYDLQMAMFTVADEENQTFLKGSARIALEVDPPFRRYIFIEQNSDYAAELRKLREEFSRHQIDIINQDANTYLLQLCTTIDWNKSRAVVFLDPYGMDVSWDVITALGRTKAVDLWYLFPLGIGVNRLLTKSGLPNEAWAARLTRIFGTDEWRDVFYRRETQNTLFGEEEQYVKDADFDQIKQFFIERLETAFVAVAPEPLVLQNSRKNPLYLLCFAAANPKGAPTAIKIAQYILRKKSSRT